VFAAFDEVDRLAEERLLIPHFRAPSTSEDVAFEDYGGDDADEVDLVAIALLDS
jgi:hypothetical protein